MIPLFLILSSNFYFCVHRQKPALNRFALRFVYIGDGVKTAFSAIDRTSVKRNGLTIIGFISILITYDVRLRWLFGIGHGEPLV